MAQEIAMRNPVYWYDFRVNAEGLTADAVKKTLKHIAKKWCFQLEAGEENGYLHYQGRVSLHEKVRKPGALKKFVDWKPNYLKATCVKNAIEVDEDERFFYQEKSATSVAGPWRDDDAVATALPIELVGKTPRQPQQFVLDTLDVFDPRHINIWYDPYGGVGKGATRSFALAKGLAVSIRPKETVKDILRIAWAVAGGARQVGFKACIIDVPRDWPFQDRMYNCIELLKDGELEEDRYTYKAWTQPRKPTVWVFTNNLPKYSSQSSDRWKIHLVENGILKRVNFKKALQVAKDFAMVRAEPPDVEPWELEEKTEEIKEVDTDSFDIQKWE